MIEEIMIGSIFGMLVVNLVVRLFGRSQRWGIRDVQVMESFSKDGPTIKYAGIGWNML